MNTHTEYVILHCAIVLIVAMTFLIGNQLLESMACTLSITHLLFGRGEKLLTLQLGRYEKLLALQSVIVCYSLFYGTTPLIKYVICIIQLLGAALSPLPRIPVSFTAPKKRYVWLDDHPGLTNFLEYPLIQRNNICYLIATARVAIARTAAKEDAVPQCNHMGYLLFQAHMEARANAGTGGFVVPALGYYSAGAPNAGWSAAEAAKYPVKELKNVDEIMKEIMTNGPVVGAMIVPATLLYHTGDSEPFRSKTIDHIWKLAGHAVVIGGWEENAWIIYNSWGKSSNPMKVEFGEMLPGALAPVTLPRLSELDLTSGNILQQDVGTLKMTKILFGQTSELFGNMEVRQKGDLYFGIPWWLLNKSIYVQAFEGSYIHQ
eukprot:TRINITY_DN7917_c0_g1_i1.p1 TRINITY_DN7917_c0_g1~~TRINITY_DN7917_c0_g1_i1.p1  ORF type:complete len:418 (-),score=0.01 TRINITY_DN7917_c0_g1_i1:504-1628(-)